VILIRQSRFRQIDMTTAVRLVCDADCACIFDNIANSVDIDSPSDKAFDFPSSDKNDDNPSFQILPHYSEWCSLLMASLW